MTIGLPIEIKVREYLSKVYLACKLAEKLQQDVIIGEKNKVYSLFKENKNFYLISKGGPVKLFNFFKKNYPENYLGILDEEAPLSNITKVELKPRIHKKIFKNIDDYFSWGSLDRNLLNKTLKQKELKNLIKCYGHPKFDLLKKRNIKIFDKEVKQIKKKYKNLVFIPSSFNFDQVLDENKMDEFQIYNFVNSDNEKVKKRYLEIKSLEQENYELFIKLLVELSRKHPNYNFVFRPHPRQSIKLLKKRILKKPKNLHVVYNYTVTPWIIASKLYIHYGCTSSLEASFLEKKMIFFIKNEKAFQGRNINLYKSYGYFFNNYSKCFKFLNYHLSKNLKKFKNSRLPLKIIHNSGNHFFLDAFIKHFKKKYDKKIFNIGLKKLKYTWTNNKNKKLKKILSFTKNYLLKSDVATNLINKVDPNLILTKEYKSKKFDSISTNEIKKTVRLIISGTNSKVKIQINKLDNDVFLLRNLKN